MLPYRDVKPMKSRPGRLGPEAGPLEQLLQDLKLVDLNPGY